MSNAFRDRIDIRHDGATDDNPGVDYSGAAYVSALSCDIAMVRGMEQFRGRQIEGGIDYVVECWFRTDVASTDRITVTGGQFNGRVMNVENYTTVRHEGEPARLLISCRELN